jgi:hypothetical protein
MKIGIVACGAIVRELVAAAKRLGWDYALTAVPAQLHMAPEEIAPAVQARLDQWAGQFDLILVGYGDCGTNGALDRLAAGYEHVVRIPGPHCYEFYGGERFWVQAEERPGTFYLTDFLAHHFDRLVWQGLGLDRHPDLKPFYFGNYTDLLYLRQLPAQDEQARAQAAADKLGVPYQEADTGLDEMERRLAALVAAYAARKTGPAGDGAPP